MLTSLDPLLFSTDDEYCSHYPLDLFDGPSCTKLATQASPGRHLQVLDSPVKTEAMGVRLCEDGYIAWLSATNRVDLYPTITKYQPTLLSRPEIEPYFSKIITFTKVAMTQPNYYLWGGTVGPNYDCSGLIQAAFAASGIWLPRNSYQQEYFTKRIKKEELFPGDLIFFGTKKVDHVALYLGEGYYIHSSGIEMGRNGIAIDHLSDEGDEVSRGYYAKLWSFGRVMQSYCP